MGVAATVLSSQTTEAQLPPQTLEKIRSVADGVIRTSSFRFSDKKSQAVYASTGEIPDGAEVRVEGQYNDWRYWNGVLNLAMFEAGEALGDSAYLEFPVKNIAFAFDNAPFFEKRYHGEPKWDYPFAQKFTMDELDDCGAMGASVIEVYRRKPRPEYRAYIDSAAKFITSREYRLADSTFVRPFPERWTIWADDLYMSVSFLARMGALTGDSRYFDDAARQVVNFHQHLFDASKGLMVHCWYSSSDRQGIAFWGRANGWALMAEVNLLDRIPKNHPMHDTLLTLLRRHIFGIARWQGSEGLWHQLLDKEDSYLETSCSAMFAYAIARSVNQGYIEKRYSSIALRGWEGVMTKILPDGEVEGVCAGTGVGDDLVFYYQRPTPINDPHGTGAVILAGVEVLRLSNK